MKKIKYSSFVFSLLFFNSCYCQIENSSTLKKVETTNSGVTVYEAKGVESKVLTNGNSSNSIQVPKLISDWTLDECNDGIYDLNNKINFLEKNNGDENQIKKYKEVKQEIIERQEFLLTQKSEK